MSNVLYIPGLGGERSINSQRRYLSFLNLLRKSSIHILFFNPLWETDEPYEYKYARLNNFYVENGEPKKVVGISAGASLAVSLTVEHSNIEHAHLICGKVTGSETIGESYQQRAPHFAESVRHSEASLRQDINESRFTAYVPKNDADGVVPTEHMLVPGAEIINLPALSHAKAITYALARYLPLV